MIEPPLWLVILPIAASPLVYLTRRWFAGALLAALVAFLTGLLAWNLPPTNPIRLMGRVFLLDPLTQHVLALLFFLAAILFLIAWRLPQGGALYPLGLVLLGLFAAAGMSRHVGISAIITALAAIAAAPIVQGGQIGLISGRRRERRLPGSGRHFSGAGDGDLAGSGPLARLADGGRRRSTLSGGCAGVGWISPAGPGRSVAGAKRRGMVHLARTGRTSAPDGRFDFGGDWRAAGCCSAWPAPVFRLCCRKNNETLQKPGNCPVTFYLIWPDSSLRISSTIL